MHALECPEQDLCFKCASVYYNISKSFHHMHKVNYRELGNRKDDKNGLFVTCQMVLSEKPTLSFMVSKGSPLLERKNEVTRHTLKEGIYMHINNRCSDKEKN